MQHRTRPSPLLGFEEGTAAATRSGSIKHASDQEAGWRPFLVLSAITFATCLAVYLALSPFFTAFSSRHGIFDPHETHISQCCRGTSHLELWGRVARSGDSHIFNSSVHCCNACKSMCSDEGPCLCNSWVFCSDSEKCGDKFGQCWLKMQGDPLSPDVQDSASTSMWTSGLVYGKDIGIVALETEHGSVRVKLLPECAPKSVAYVLERLKNERCTGGYYYRAESRGSIWDELGNPSDKSTTGPPYGLVQGSLENHCSPFKGIETEACPNIRRGTVGWIGNGPDFFISLANHEEWYPKYTVFAHVLLADIPLVEKLVGLPTITSVWEGIQVSVLNESVSIRIKRI
ncbi:hypothetical protein L7F22_057470 [Adiantum nelumboides]|nr:hypothetical protein [Adiantum nelumboides]